MKHASRLNALRVGKWSIADQRRVQPRKNTWKNHLSKRRGDGGNIARKKEGENLLFPTRGKQSEGMRRNGASLKRSNQREGKMTSVLKRDPAKRVYRKGPLDQGLRNKSKLFPGLFKKGTVNDRLQGALQNGYLREARWGRTTWGARYR